MYLFLIGVCFILLGGIASILARDERKGFVFLLFYGTGAFVSLAISLRSLIFSYRYGCSFEMGFPAGTLSLVFDPLSAFFVTLIIVMGFIGVLYGASYLKSYHNKGYGLTSHYLFLGIFFSSLILLPVIRNAFFFIIVWEFMSLSSFFLVIFESKKREVLSAGINYLVTMHISVAFLIIGFVILSSISGSYDFSSFESVLKGNRYLADAVFVILFLGFGIKAGFVPFHFWLPKAHPAAPSHISGVMSGLMIKIGIYGILRVILMIEKPSFEMAYFLLVISVFTMLYGIFNASAQKDIKRLLAYSSIENIGIIGIGISVGMLGIVYENGTVAVLGFAGALFHLLNHAIFKELLFFCAGSVYSKTHTRNSEKLGGLIKKMPYTGSLFLLGSMSICALPPLNGFISEFLIFMGLLNGLKIHIMNILIIFPIVMAALAFAGTMAMLTFTKAFGITFLGMPRSQEAEHVEGDVSPEMIAPKVILGIMIILLGLLPQAVLPVITNVATQFCTQINGYILSYFVMNMLWTLSICLFGLLLVILFACGLKELYLKRKNVQKYKTWDCGYQAGNTRMQYSSSSYSSLFTDTFENALHKKTSQRTPNGVFPQRGYLKFKIYDNLELYILKPIVKVINNFFSKFIWIQSGKTQIYILYGFLFLILSIGGLFFFTYR